MAETRLPRPDAGGGAAGAAVPLREEGFEQAPPRRWCSISTGRIAL